MSAKKKTRQKPVKAVSKRRTPRAAKQTRARGVQKKPPAHAAHDIRRAIIPLSKRQLRTFMASPEMQTTAQRYIEQIGPESIVFMVSVLAARTAIKQNAKDWPHWVAQVYSDWLKLERVFNSARTASTA